MKELGAPLCPGRASAPRVDNEPFLAWMAAQNCIILGLLYWFTRVASDHGSLAIPIGVLIVYGLVSLQHSGIEDRLISVGLFLSAESLKSAAQRESWASEVLKGRTADINALSSGERWANHMRTARSVIVIGYAVYLMYRL